MLFSSFEFIFAFLPVTFLGYFLLNKYKQANAAKIWLFSCSLFFYGWWNPLYVPLILSSLVFNFGFGNWLNATKSNPALKKSILIFGISANLGLLFFYKYMDFFIANYNYLSSNTIVALHLVLPLGISFITFQKIAYLVDSYTDAESTKDYNFINFCLFVLFFPQLIAGPIVHHSEVMPAFKNPLNLKLNYFNISKGLYIFLMGLCKKLVFADSFAVIANAGYGNTASLSTIDGWLTAFAYAFQLYFDFSGYSDMAIGAGLFFNIQLPQNFNSPYKSLNIQDFWRRWHITLGRFLTRYFYIPLGGSRKGEYRTLVNVFLTMFVSGIWHGAGWTFVLWGIMHGTASVIFRLWGKTKIEMPAYLAWFLTFLFVNLAWVFFRASSIGDAMNVLYAMFDFSKFSLNFTVIEDYRILPMVLAGTLFLFFKNTNELLSEFTLSRANLVKLVLMAVLGMLFLNSITAGEFLYFDF